ncbi:MAG TPA: GDSL-type esterase/lipase family protein [Ilumatobacteraceae bacterium]|nr:GDSL-type esterase/lipase family protein [Ilumatobacteraceae bacterium]
MREIELLAADAPVRIAGVIDLDRTDDGATTHRLPARARSQSMEIAIAAVSSMPSGGRIEMITDATEIELDLLVTRIAFPGRDPWPATVDLVVDGEVAATAATEEGHLIRLQLPPSTAFDLDPGQPATIRFDGLAAGSKRVEIWLPHNAAVELRALRVGDGATVDRPPEPTRRWVHYGSSISHSMEADSPTGVWPVVAARAAGVDLYNLGLAGQCQLDQFAARTIRDLPADVVSLKLGINVVNVDSMRERTFVPAVHGLLDTVRDGHPTAPIMVISPIICPPAETHPGPTVPDPDRRFAVVERPEALMLGALTLSRIRELLELIVANRRRHGDANLHYLDGHELFGPGDVADLPDDLHPNAAGYVRMGERFVAAAFSPGAPFA